MSSEWAQDMRAEHLEAVQAYIDEQWEDVPGLADVRPLEAPDPWDDAA